MQISQTTHSELYPERESSVIGSSPHHRMIGVYVDVMDDVIVGDDPYNGLHRYEIYYGNFTSASPN
jgi:hypothetical protein